MKALFRMVLAVAVLASLAMMAAPPKIQIALLLDTSNSMDGLIEQAKTQLWNIVNEFALARYEGEMPELEIALYEYGNDGLPEENGYIRQVLPLTTDLDMISEKLFELTTNGGSEYCGWVIREAAEQLAWSSGDRDFKAIFIAGNEGFDQGKVDFRASCRAAIEKGIIVNTIFCGDHDEGVAGHWKEGADLADGAYMNIDQNRITVDIPAPQDSELARLNQALNETYLPYGKQGEARKELQLKQDAYASGYSPGVLAQRTATKAKRFYKNAEWDLIDALDEEVVELEALAPEELPDTMRQMSPEQRKAFVAAQKARRDSLRRRIEQLSRERKKFLAAKRRKLSDQHTLEAAIVRIVHEQAERKGFTFEQ